MAQRGRDLPGRKLRVLVSRLDISTFIGRYPWHDLPPWDAAMLREELASCGIERAWVSDLSAIFGRADERAAMALAESLAPHDGLRPVPSVDPGRAGWERVLDRALNAGAPAVRSDPTVKASHPVGREMQDLVAACTERALPLMMSVRFEDVRQRVPEDEAPDLPPWAVRQLIRSHPGLRLIITQADRDFVEQVHFGSTPTEAARLLWDITWIWGPPEDHLALLCETVGSERFALGTASPLRLTENGLAKLDLLDISPAQRAGLEGANAEAFAG
jgi:hypothetical protein